MAANNIGARAKELFRLAGGESLPLPERLRLLRTCLALAEAERAHKNLLDEVGLPTPPPGKP